MSARKKTRSLTAPVRSLFASDAAGGVLLIAVTLLAMVAANSAWSEHYAHLFHAPLAWTPVAKLDNLHLWINDALMAVFFFVVGLEVKREIVEGDLADARSRRLPLIAAVSGMAVPAVVFLAIVGDSSSLVRGWAIPAATDIAFAMGLIGLLGQRVPASLRLFLLTVAIVDDIGAIIVIALFYTAQIAIGWTIAAIAVLAALTVLNMARVDRLLPYILGAVLLWVCVLNSGVHATIAGVLAALTVPMRRRNGDPLLASAEHALTPWNAYLIIPVFALANAGVDMRALGLEALAAPLPLAIAAGLFVGKQVGILGAVAGARALGLAVPPAGATWIQIWGAALLCGIGFTMSLFIAALAFGEAPALYEDAKLGVLFGTLASATCGYLVLRFAKSPAPVATSANCVADEAAQFAPNDRD